MRKPVVLGLLGLFTSLVPAFAGTVYVPVAPPQQIGDVLYRTQVVVGNPGNVERRLTTTFIASGRDGIRTGTAPSAASIPANGTLVLTNVTPTGRDGMLEISGAPQLAVSARLEAVSRTGRVLSTAPLPVVGSDHLVPRGAAAQLQGISRVATGVEHRFGLINLGAKEAVCTVTVYRAGGSPVGTAARLTVPARSHTTLAAPLAAFGSTLFTEARVEVSCDAPFYPYAVQLSPGGAAAVSVGPSVTLDSELRTAQELRAKDDGKGDGDTGGRNGGGGDDEGEDDGGAGDDEGGDATGEPVVGQDQLSFRGLFLNARQGNSYRVFDLPLRPGVRYRQITVEFDLYLNKWVTPLFHGITALRRNDRTLYYGLIVRGDRAKTVLDLGKDEIARDTGPWKQRTNYHVRLVTNAQDRKVTLELFQGGQLVHTLSGAMTTRDLMVSAGTKMRVDFGGTKVADGAYFPPYGWRYSNLTVKAEPF
ncbi:MAG TPA: hypothetical protein VKM72_08925 [Thermoanaerobaculia bacterium]|nr:hypothetical protein [Thermoanaerobaculia bacterium]